MILKIENFIYWCILSLQLFKMSNYFDCAKCLAQKSPMESRYGAILVYQNKVISVGFNDYSGKYRTTKKSCFLRALQALDPC